MGLSTKWGREIDRNHVLEEYPRPQLVRESYLNLNGEWDYSITSSPKLPEKYKGKILVPFSPETQLSGVGRQVMPEEVLHYRRNVVLTEDFFTGGRCLLHFGAVDQSCAVFWNGTEVIRHEGGYLPFTADVTELARTGDNVLQVAVKDPSDTSCHARGKQKLKRGGMWYTAQSGIWQTVWMECVPEDYITALRLSCRYDEGKLELKALSNHRASLAARALITLRGEKVGEFEFSTDRTVLFPIKDFESWTPEQPVLYDISVSAGKDRVKSYFAMRKVSVGADKNGILRFMLNNRPYF
nr:glycoside hydrolase family 2 [Lachnospiraceae bacterium]